MKTKPEQKYFKHSNGVLAKTASEQKKGAGKKVGAPAAVEVKKEKPE